jgi:hypothetical protein
MPDAECEMLSFELFQRPVFISAFIVPHFALPKPLIRFAACSHPLPEGEGNVCGL